MFECLTCGEGFEEEHEAYDHTLRAHDQAGKPPDERFEEVEE